MEKTRKYEEELREVREGERERERARDGGQERERCIIRVLYIFLSVHLFVFLVSRSYCCAGTKSNNST